MNVSLLVEGRDIESYGYVPICSLYLSDVLKASAITEMDIRKSVSGQKDYQDLQERCKNAQSEDKTILRQVDAYVAQAARSSALWLRDCLLAAGIQRGKAKDPQSTAVKKSSCYRPRISYLKAT